jgi:hypothetical protein
LAVLHTAVGSQDSQDSSLAEVSSQAPASSPLLSPRAHHKCLVDLGKLQDTQDGAFNYAMPPHALVHRRRFSYSWSDAIRRLHPVR